MPPVLPLQLCICCIVGPSHKTRQTPLSWEKLQRVDLLKLEVLITATPTKLPFEAALSCLAAILILFLSFVRSLEAECKHWYNFSFLATWQSLLLQDSHWKRSLVHSGASCLFFAVMCSRKWSYKSFKVQILLLANRTFCCACQCFCPYLWNCFT